MNMKLNTLTKLMKWFAVSLACAATSLVGVPVDIDYNGSLADPSGSLLDGTYYMKFAIATDDAATFYWNNEDGNAATGLPEAAVEVAVTQGLFSVVLEGVDSSVLADDAAVLWVFVSDAADGTYESLGYSAINSVPYAVVASVAETAESVDAENIMGEITGDQIADGAIGADDIEDGSIHASKLGNITLDFPQLDADGIPGGDSKDVNMADMLLDIADNSQISLEKVRELADDGTALVFLREDWGINNGPLPNGGEFLDPFPVMWPYETNASLMPHLDVLDEAGNSLIDGGGTQIPGLTFVRRFDDIDAPHDHPKNTKEERLSVKGVPTTSGDYTIYVRATTSWGHHYLRKYVVIVRPVDIVSGGILGYRRDKGGAVTSSDELWVVGGDQVWFQFQTDEPLTDETSVRWKKNGSTVAVLNGETGRTYYVNSVNGDGTSPSGGARKIDEDPEGVFVNDEGEYGAEILFDWGQTLAIGNADLDYIDDGIAFDEDAGFYYETPVDTYDLFDQWIPGSAALGAGNPFVDDEDFEYGFTPAPDDPDPLFAETIEAGEDDKSLWVQNVFGSAADEYVYGSMQYQWYQQRYRYVIVSEVGTWVEVMNVIQEATIADQQVDLDIELELDGFGAILPAGTTTLHATRMNNGIEVPITNVGMFAGIQATEPSSAYPEDVNSSTQRWYMADGSPFSFYNENPERDEDFPYALQERVIYWVYVNNGFIDKIVPQAAIVEVDENINIANNLVSREQVAGYPVTVGGDFGTTNNQIYAPMFPADSVQGVNDVAYWWQPDVPSAGWELVNPSLANSIRILGPYAENRDINGTDDIEVQLTVHSGYAQETTWANVGVQSDVVIWTMYMQTIDLNTDPITAGPEETSLEIDAGDDIRLTMTAYVRPSRIFNVGDDGLYDNLNRTVMATFWLLPDSTGVPVQLTNDVTMTLASDSDEDGWEALLVDADENHVPFLNEAGGQEFQREQLVWEVILEDPMQQYAITNVATGLLYAVVTSYVDGVQVNQFSTLPGAPNALDQGEGENAVDGKLDTMVEMPLELNLIVNPIGD